MLLLLYIIQNMSVLIMRGRRKEAVKQCKSVISIPQKYLSKLFIQLDT